MLHRSLDKEALSLRSLNGVTELMSYQPACTNNDDAILDLKFQPWVIDVTFKSPLGETGAMHGIDCIYS